MFWWAAPVLHTEIFFQTYEARFVKMSAIYVCMHIIRNVEYIHNSWHRNMWVHIKAIVYIFDYLPILELIQDLNFRLEIQTKVKLGSKNLLAKAAKNADFSFFFNYVLFKNINLGKHNFIVNTFEYSILEAWIGNKQKKISKGNS